MITTVRRGFLENSPMYYPFGNTRTRNILKDFSLEVDAANINTVKILLLGCGDLRNVLHAVSNPNMDLHVYLNDFCTPVLARNLVILKIISAVDFNPKNEEDFAFLWDFWYNLEWQETTQKRFVVLIKDLIDNVLPTNVAVPGAGHLETLQEVWRSWLSISTLGQSESELLMKEIANERSDFLPTVWSTLNPEKIEEKDKSNKSSFFEAVIIKISEEVTNQIGIEESTENVKKKIQDEIRNFFKNGSCRLQNDVQTVCVNPSLLEPISRSWQVHPTLSPFAGYLPLTREELDTSNEDKIMIRSCQKILKRLVSSYRQRLESVQVFLYLGDAVEFCYTHQTETKFDVIDSSNLADHIGLINLLNACNTRLSDNPKSLFYTETMNWPLLSRVVNDYVEKALSAPLSMIPTIYGLRLVNHVELGAPTLLNLRRSVAPPVLFCWKKVPPVRNVAMSSSPILHQYLEQLANLCFNENNLLSLTWMLRGNEPSIRCGMLCYTPLTFHFVLTSMAQRLGGDGWMKKAIDKLDIHPTFNLTRRTAEAWKNGEKVLKMSASTTVKSMDAKRSGGTPPLRLVFLLRSNFSKKLYLTGAGDHFIDNFKLDIRKTAFGFDAISVSCILAPGHGIGKSHMALIVNAMRGKPVFIFKSLKIEEIELPYPLDLSQSLLPPFPSGEMLVVDSCTESVDQYNLTIMVQSFGKSISELKVSTNAQKPCESSHDVVLSLRHPENMKPLTLSFSYPVLADNIRVASRDKGRFIDLVIKKALQEPWPCEFQVGENSKWVGDRLVPWIEPKSPSTFHDPCSNSLQTHVDSQFDYQHLDNPSFIPKTPLNFVRDVVRALFISSVTIFHMKYKDSSWEREWYFRVHRPIRISPLGTPMLIVTALDNRLVEMNMRVGKWDENKMRNDFARIFPDLIERKNSMTFQLETEEQLQLWRYVLRINSTKIVPTAWQRTYVPLGENSPWLATFITPLYLDAPVREEIIEDSDTDDCDACAFCHKMDEKLKYCSRCRGILYCSVECQRSHWPTHKVLCKK